MKYSLKYKKYRKQLVELLTDSELVILLKEHKRSKNLSWSHVEHVFSNLSIRFLIRYSCFFDIIIQESWITIQEDVCAGCAYSCTLTSFIFILDVCPAK